MLQIFCDGPYNFLRLGRAGYGRIIGNLQVIARHLTDTMAPNLEDIAVLRVVVREGFSRDMADVLLDDVFQAVEEFETALPASPRPRHTDKTRAVC